MGLLGQRANRFIILEDVAKLPPVGTGLAYTLQQYMSVPVSTGHVLPVDFTFLSLTTSKFDYLFICWRATRFFFFSVKFCFMFFAHFSSGLVIKFLPISGSSSYIRGIVSVVKWIANMFLTCWFVFDLCVGGDCCHR